MRAFWPRTGTLAFTAVLALVAVAVATSRMLRFDELASASASLLLALASVAFLAGAFNARQRIQIEQRMSTRDVNGLVSKIEAAIDTYETADRQSRDARLAALKGLLHETRTSVKELDQAITDLGDVLPAEDVAALEAAVDRLEAAAGRIDALTDSAISDHESER